MAVWRLQVNTGGANVADYCLQNHVAALWAGKVLAMERLHKAGVKSRFNFWDVSSTSITGCFKGASFIQLYTREK